MWLIEFCEKVGGMSSDAKAVITIIFVLAFLCLGAVFNLISQWIDSRKSNKDDRD